jgi:hypothetical protein
VPPELPEDAPPALLLEAAPEELLLDAPLLLDEPPLDEPLLDELLLVVVVHVPLTQVPPGQSVFVVQLPGAGARSKAYTAPKGSLSSAPTIAVVPFTATADPNESPTARSVGRSLAVSVHVVPERWNPYAAPPPAASLPATARSSPSSATELPNQSFTAASLADRVACNDHEEPFDT